MAEGAAPKMNRAQRRRWQANFRRLKLESIPRETLEFDVAANGTVTAHAPTCDMPGCGFAWGFVTMGTVDGKRKPVARRCAVHRLA